MNLHLDYSPRLPELKSGETYDYDSTLDLPFIVAADGKRTGFPKAPKPVWAQSPAPVSKAKWTSSNFRLFMAVLAIANLTAFTVAFTVTTLMIALGMIGGVQ